jgi:hypothetical protein
MGIVLIVLLAFSGCAALKANYGSIVPDQAAQKDFEAFAMDPKMNYYYSGPDIAPNALIGLNKDYVLDNDLWKPISADPKVFKSLIRGMQSKGQQYQKPQYGFVMKDHQDKPIGVWYSMLFLKRMIVRMGEGNKVNVYTPELMAYPDAEGGGVSFSPTSPR